MNYLITIPAYNAAATLPELVFRIRRFARGVDVLIVDDGSSDDTAAVAQWLKAGLIQHPRNRGKGEALRTAFAAALASGVDAVVHLDADLQHEPEYLPLFFAGFEAGQADILIGTRDFRPDIMPFLRRLTNRWTSWWISRMAGAPIADSQSGYRLIGRRALEAVHPISHRYDFESEFLIHAGRAGLRIGEVRISTVYGSETSFINPWRDTLRFIRLIRQFWWSRPKTINGTESRVGALHPPK